MYCFDHSEIGLFNNLQAYSASILEIIFSIPDNKCEYDGNQDVCVPNADWNQYIKTKYLILYQN